MSHQVYEGGVLVEEWDDETRTYTDYRTDPPTSREYTVEEHEAADASALAAARAANEAALREGLQNVINAALDRQATAQGIIDTPNSTIRDNPAPHIVALARVCKREERAIIRLARLVGGLVDSADTGTD